MGKITSPLLAGAMGLLLAGTIIVGGAIAEDIIKTRKNDMDMLKDAMKTINGVVEAGGPVGDAQAPAQQIAEITKNIPNLFPEGSDQGDTTAKPEIWQKRDEFNAYAQKAQQAAGNLVEATKGNDPNTLKTAFNAMGGTCGACHENFKKKK